MKARRIFRSRTGSGRSSTRHKVNDFLYGADGDPHVHQVGRRVAEEARHGSLRLLGTVGEPINPEAWMWYRERLAGTAARSWIRGGRRRRGTS